MTHMHLHAPKATSKSAHATICPDCKKRTRMLSFFTPWYGWESTCIKCGRSWSDGEWMPLDFVRKSRQKSINAAKQKWRGMPPQTENHCGLDTV